MRIQITIQKEGFKCNRCGYEWLPRSKQIVDPTRCAKCNSPYWNKERKNRRKNGS